MDDELVELGGGAQPNNYGAVGGEGDQGEEQEVIPNGPDNVQPEAVAELGEDDREEDVEERDEEQGNNGQDPGALQQVVVLPDAQPGPPRRSQRATERHDYARLHRHGRN